MYNNDSIVVYGADKKDKTRHTWRLTNNPGVDEHLVKAAASRDR
jgi:hypothetical protein